MLLGGSAAAAFTATSGFTATTYATGVTPATAIAGTAFVGSTAYAVDPADGIVYRGSGTAPVALSPFATVGGAPTGIAASAGKLYVARNAIGDIVQVDPVTAAWSSIATIGCPNGVAGDPVTGDLFVSTCTSIYRVSAPGTAPIVTKYADLVPGGFAAYGIAFSPDGWIYTVATANSTVYRLAGPAPTSSLTPGPIGTFAGTRGIAVVGSYLFLSASDGSITKLPIPELAQPQVTALSGGDAGDLASIGPDGCVYASQGAAVVRLADAAGTCDLASAAPPAPPPSLVLVRLSTGVALVGGGDQSFVATLSNTTPLGGVSVTFTVSGAYNTSKTEPTAPNGTAGFAYSATTTGLDTIVATAVVNGATITSNALTLDWPRAIDTAPPTIAYAVTGDAGANFGCPRADIGTLGVTEYCGWYTSPPTLTWTVTPNGPSLIDWSRTSCPPFTLLGASPVTGTPVTCIAYNGDGISSALQVRLQATAAPPTIAATATTSDGNAYLAGTPTELPVTVTFLCGTSLGPDGLVGCSPPVTVSALGLTTVSGSVIDIANTTRTASFTVDIVDRTPPAVTAALTPAPDANGNVPLSATVHIAATDNVAVASIAYWAAGAQTIAPTTRSGATADVVVNAIGTTTVSFVATDTSGNVSATGHIDVHVTATQPTTLRIASPAFIASGGAVSAILVGGDGITPVAGRMVTFAAGTATATGVTNVLGVASATLPLGSAQYALTATFAGDTAYLASSDTRTLTIYEPTHFVVWGPRAGLGARVQLYGDDWAKQITDAAMRRALEDFKGYAASVTATRWSGAPGDTVRAPRTIARYVGVIVTTSVARTGRTVGGDIARVVVVRVEGDGRYAYDGRVGERVFGTVVGSP